MQYVCFNGTFIQAGNPVLTADNRAFKYGDGLFETMRLQDGKILLEAFHFERLFAGFHLLQIAVDDLKREVIVNHIQGLCFKNKCLAAARIRLAVYRQRDQYSFLIEATTLEPAVYALNEKGYAIDIFPDARKACDLFSNLKSANYLLYVMGDRFARQKQLDECLVLNAFGNICDGSKTNVFIIKGETIFTPSLEQGCINGVMRRHVIESLMHQDISVVQGIVTVENMLDADAVFMTNAIRGICWVERFGKKVFVSDAVKKFYSLVFNQTARLV